MYSIHMNLVYCVPGTLLSTDNLLICKINWVSTLEKFSFWLGKKEKISTQMNIQGSTDKCSKNVKKYI